MTIRRTSVIVCTRNRANLLSKFINQLRALDYPLDAFEIVIVDNDSTDHTRKVVEQFIAEPGVPVRYVAESRLGITFARNRGAEVARFPYLAYVDDDCSIEPDWLLKLIEGFDLHEHVVAVGGKVLPEWDQQQKPPWLGPELDPWLAGNSRFGTQPRLLDKEIRIIECNMALMRETWRACGGFLGMEQFGSKHMAAGEVIYLLNKIERQGGKVAFIPGAIVHHHIGRRSQRWMISRAYWQGVSDGIMDYLLHGRSWELKMDSIILDSAAMVILFGFAGFSYLKIDQAKGMFHLMRAVRRFGLILSEMHLVGDWTRARSWASEHRPGR